MHTVFSFKIINPQNYILMKALIQKQMLTLLILMSGSLLFAQIETNPQTKQNPKKSNTDLHFNMEFSNLTPDNFETDLEEYEKAYEQMKISSFIDYQHSTMISGQRSACTNDDVCDAIALTMDVPQPFNNSCATAQFGEVNPGGGSFPTCNAQNGWCNFETNVQNSLWYTFTAPSSGIVSIVSPEFDTQLALWSVGDCSDFGTFSEIAANDDGADDIEAGAHPFAPAIINANVVPGQTYYIQLDGWGGASGSGTIWVTEMNIEIYSNRAAFNSDACNLQLEDFEGSNAEPGTFIECTWQQPFNKNIGECYPQGEIIPGFTFHSTGLGQISALAEGFFGLTSTAIGPARFSDNAFMKFDCGTKRYGLTRYIR